MDTSQRTVHYALLIGIKPAAARVAALEQVVADYDS